MHIHSAKTRPPTQFWLNSYQRWPLPCPTYEHENWNEIRCETKAIRVRWPRIFIVLTNKFQLTCFSICPISRQCVTAEGLKQCVRQWMAANGNQVKYDRISWMLWVPVTRYTASLRIKQTIREAENTCCTYSISLLWKALCSSCKMKRKSRNLQR